jgi:hypothetical protein
MTATSENPALPATGNVGGADAGVGLGITPQATTPSPAWMTMMCSPSAIMASATSIPWKSTEPVAVALPVASAFRSGKAAKLALAMAQVPACMVARASVPGAKPSTSSATWVPSPTATRAPVPLTPGLPTGSS